MKVLFSCVAENGPDWFRRVDALAMSIRKFGGLLAASEIVVNFVGSVDPAFERALATWGVEVRVVPQFDRRSVYANKLRMFELSRDRHFDVLVGLDCDVLVMGDLSQELSTRAIGVKPADIGVLTSGQWEALFASLRIPEPAERVVATSTGEVIYPYYNSGVVAVPHHLCDLLYERWSHYIAAILGVYEGDDPVVPAQWRFHLDQFALACALADERLPVHPFDIRMNFPTHLPVHPTVLPPAPEPLVVHYHRRVDRNGLLLRSQSPIADSALDTFNHALAAHRSLDYHRLRRPSLQRRTRRAAATGVRRILSRF